MHLKDFVPPIMLELASTIRSKKYGWFGNYSSWSEALNECSGYNSKYIAEKVKIALLKVKEGVAAYERDSVAFDRIEYSWPLLAGLMWVSAQSGGKLNVLDFGGSLGSTYFQNRKFLTVLNDLKWNVVEQEVFVELGKNNFEDSTLRFFKTVDSCVEKQLPDVFLYSCVLQYLEDPFKALSSAFSYLPNFLIVDNMPFTEAPDRITIQKVPPEIYDASYPCWILNRKKFIEFCLSKYELISAFTSHLTIRVDGTPIPYEGFIFRKNVKSLT